MEQYHHYIPRFILRKYAPYDYDKDYRTTKYICGPNHLIDLSSERQRKPRNKIGNKNPFINVITLDGVLRKEPISKLYGVTNMYEDPSATDAMIVEKLLARSESDVAAIFERFISNDAEGKDAKVTRRELTLIKKFIFVMNYRKDRRRNQYVNNNFDAITGRMMRKFMAENNIASPQRVWLNNIRTILEAPDVHRLIDEGSQSLFPCIMNDLKVFLTLFYICLWKAPAGTEFLIADCTYGLWEGIGDATGVVHFIYHQFYPISPTIMFVHCDTRFKGDKRGIEMNRMMKEMGARQSWFDRVPHPVPKTTYKFPAPEGPGLFGGVPDPDDEYIYSFVEIPKISVTIINGITIDNSVQISFRSELYFYKVLKFFNRMKHEMWPPGKDVTPMIEQMLKKLRENQGRMSYEQMWCVVDEGGQLPCMPLIQLDEHDFLHLRVAVSRALNRKTK